MKKIPKTLFDKTTKTLLAVILTRNLRKIRTHLKRAGGMTATGGDYLLKISLGIIFFFSCRNPSQRYLSGLDFSHFSNRLLTILFHLDSPEGTFRHKLWGLKKQFLWKIFKKISFVDEGVDFCSGREGLRRVKILIELEKIFGLKIFDLKVWRNHKLWNFVHSHKTKNKKFMHTKKPS